MTTPLSTGRALHALAARLYPLRRSIAGPAVRETLAALAEHAPIATREIASGTPVFDWATPREWTLRESYFVAPDGRRLADATVQNLHALNYGVAFRGRVDRAELDRHLHSLPDRPDAIPYRTSYWRDAWGFCVPDRLRRSLPEGEYEVVIDAEHREGSMSFGECVLAGESGDDLSLVKTHGPPKIVETRRDFPFIVVSPQCPRRGWNADAVNALLDEVLAKYRVDADRVYLTGLSMGGYGTWHLAAIHPERFAAIAPICGGGNVTGVGGVGSTPRKENRSQVRASGRSRRSSKKQ